MRKSLPFLVAMHFLLAGGAARAEPKEQRQTIIAGHATVDGATPSQRANPIPVHEVFGPRDWKKQPFRLAVMLVEFSDTQHDSAHTPAFYENLIFTRNAQLKTSSGKPAFGSVADWYVAQSQDRFVLTGKVFDWVNIDQTYKAVHAMTRKEAEDKYLRAALTKLRQREGERVLDGFDGWFFIHAGPIARPNTNILWSHRSTLDGVRYLTTFETEAINVACHEFGHILGLPDLYAKPGVRHSFGPWCAMAAGYRGDFPGSFCAWSKARLGWCRPTVIDANIPQKLVLRPIQTHPHDAFLIPLNAQDGIGAEFLLLENRADLLNDAGRQSGLLIWRITRPADQENHPVFDLTLPGPDDETGEPLLVRRVAWPSVTARDYRLPHSAERLGVTIQNIRQSGGDVFFEVIPAAE